MSQLQLLRDRLQAFAAQAPPAVSQALARLAVSLSAADMQNALRYASHVALELEKMQDTSFREIYDSIVELRRSSMQAAQAASQAARAEPPQQNALKQQQEQAAEVQQMHNAITQIMQVIQDNNREFSQQFTALSGRLEQFQLQIVSRVNTLEIQIAQALNAIDGLRAGQQPQKREDSELPSPKGPELAARLALKNTTEQYNDSGDFGTVESDQDALDDEVSSIVQQQTEITSHVHKVLSARKPAPQRVEKGVQMSREWDAAPLTRSPSALQDSDMAQPARKTSRKTGRKAEHSVALQGDDSDSAADITDTAVPQPSKVKTRTKTAKAALEDNDEPSVDKSASIQALDDMLQELSSSADQVKKKKRKKQQPAEPETVAAQDPPKAEKQAEPTARPSTAQKKTVQREKAAKDDASAADTQPKKPKSQAAQQPPKQHESAAAAPRKKAK